MKDKSNYDLFKVPDSAIVKSQAIEIGMLKGEIQELNEEIEKFNNFKEERKLLNQKINKLNQKYSKVKYEKLERKNSNFFKENNILSKKIRYWRLEVKSMVSDNEMEFHYVNINNLEI